MYHLFYHSSDNSEFSVICIILSKTKIEDIKQNKESVAESMLKNLFKMELNVYSQDDTYSQSLKQVKNKLEEDKKNKKSGIITDNHATFCELMLHIESYYTVSKLSLISDQLKLKHISEKLPYLPHQIVSKRSL